MIKIKKRIIVVLVIILFLFNFFESTLLSQSLNNSIKTEDSFYRTMSTLGINNLTWHYGFFETSNYDGRYINATDYFVQENNETHVHVREEVDTYLLNIGAYALVPVVNSSVYFSLEAKLKADVVNEVKLAVVLLDPATLNYIDGGKWLYHKGSILETDWLSFTINYTVKNYEQVYLFFYYSDETNYVTHQEIWIRNLVVKNNISHTLEERRDSTPTYASIEEFKWTVGTFSRDLSQPLTEVSNGEFEYSVSNELYFKENGTGTFDAFVGAYTIVPLLNGYLRYYAEIRAKSDTIDDLSFKMIAYTPNSNNLITTNIFSDFSNLETTDTGFVSKSDYVYIGDYTNVTLLFCYEDINFSNKNQEFWVKNLQVATLTNWTSPLDEINQPTNLFISDFNWLPGTFSRDTTSSLRVIEAGEYVYDLSSELHIKENGSGTYDTVVGFIALIPLSNGYCNYSALVRAKADANTYVSLGVRVYDPQTLSLIPSEFDLGFYQPNTSDTGFVYRSKEVYVGNYEEVYLLIYYLDGHAENQNHEFWINELQIATYRNWIRPENPPDIPDSNSNSVDDQYEENDNFQTAPFLKVNSSYSLYAFDDDYFQLEVEELQKLTVVLSFSSSAVDLDLYLCDYKGNTLVSSTSQSTEEKVSHLTLYSGIYYLVVVFYSGLEGRVYMLNISLIDSGLEDDKFEDNENIESAKQLELNQTYDLFYLDYDIFKVILQEGDFLLLEMEFDDEIIDLDVYLLPVNFSGEVSEILAKSENYTSPEILKYKAEYTGVYYILIVAYIDEASSQPFLPSSYVLKLSLILPENGSKTKLIPYSIVGLIVGLCFISIIKAFRGKRKRKSFS